MPDIAPNPVALSRLRSKTAVAARLNTAQWQELRLGLLDRAFFSAGVDDIRTLAVMQSKLDQAQSLGDGKQPFISRERFVRDMRRELGAAEGDSGELTDLASDRRLGLIYNFQREDAQEYARWLDGQDPDLLAAYPCQELVRIASRDVPRDWAEIWVAHGGVFYGGRMIAPKDAKIWTEISRFRRPWPPFDFGSGMGVADVERSEAIALGVIRPDYMVAPQNIDFNAGLEASVPDASPALLEGFKQVFGEQVSVDRSGKIVWQGDRIRRLVERSLTERGTQWTLDLGIASPETVRLSAAQNVDLSGARLLLDSDTIRHAMTQHGNEPAGNGQQSLTSYDFRLLPHVWRAPDQILPGHKAGDLTFIRDLFGDLYMVTWRRGQRGVRAHTIWKKTGTSQVSHAGPGGTP